MKRNHLLVLLLSFLTLTSFEKKPQPHKSLCGPFITIINNSSGVVRSVNVTAEYGTVMFTNIYIQPGQSFYAGQYAGTSFTVKLIGTFSGSVSVLHGSDLMFCQAATGITNVNFQTTDCNMYNLEVVDEGCN